MPGLITRKNNPLIHFVGRHLRSDKERILALNQILRTQKFIPLFEQEIFGEFYKFGKGFKRGALPVCFTDLSWGNLKLHTKRYSSFGIAFSKEYIIKHHGNPVFYWAQECIALKKSSSGLIRYMKKLEKMIQSQRKSAKALAAMNTLYNAIWPILKFSKFYQARIFANVYEEQEWRVLIDKKCWDFDRRNVAFLICPRKYVSSLRKAWPQIKIKAI